jgi:hypothetical protein
LTHDKQNDKAVVAHAARPATEYDNYALGCSWTLVDHGASAGSMPRPDFEAMLKQRLEFLKLAHTTMDGVDIITARFRTHGVTQGSSVSRASELLGLPHPITPSCMEDTADAIPMIVSSRLCESQRESTRIESREPHKTLDSSSARPAVGFNVPKTNGSSHPLNNGSGVNTAELERAIGA